MRWAAQVEPATVALHGVRRSRITVGDTVVVQGAGPIGLLALQFARWPAPRMCWSSSHRRRAGGLPANLVRSTPRHRTRQPNASRTTRKASARMSSSSAPVYRACCRPRSTWPAPSGVVQLLSFLAEPTTINAARWLAKQVTVVASNAFTHDDFRRSMTFLADGSGAGAAPAQAHRAAR